MKIKKLLSVFIILSFISSIFAGCADDNTDELTDSVIKTSEVTIPEETTYPELKIEITNNNNRIYESMDYYFVPDNEILGVWQAFGNCPNDYEEHFLEEYIQYYLENDITDDLLWKEVTVYSDGKAKITYSYNVHLITEWTKGYILNIMPGTISEYMVKNINDTDYMLAEWKSGDYTERGGKPSYILLKRSADVPDDLSKYDAIKRNYDWYIDQYETGEYRMNNCGPTCVIMAAKWYDENFKPTAEEARNWNINEGEDWNLKIMQEFFNSENIPYEIYEKMNYDSVSMLLDMGNIIIVPVSMKYIKENNFNNNEGDHFVIIKGKIALGGKEYFEVYDPNSSQEKDTDGKLKGKDCLYLCDEVIEASKALSKDQSEAQYESFIVINQFK